MDDKLKHEKMAPNDDEPASAENKKCRYCKSGVEKSGVKCSDCGVCFHPSCALRITGLQVASASKSLILCATCSKKTRETEINKAVSDRDEIIETLRKKLALLESETNNNLFAEVCKKLETMENSILRKISSLEKKVNKSLDEIGVATVPPDGSVRTNDKRQELNELDDNNHERKDESTDTAADSFRMQKKKGWNRNLTNLSSDNNNKCNDCDVNQPNVEVHKVSEPQNIVCKIVPVASQIATEPLANIHRHQNRSPRARSKLNNGATQSVETITNITDTVPASNANPHSAARFDKHRVGGHNENRETNRTQLPKELRPNEVYVTDVKRKTDANRSTGKPSEEWKLVENKRAKRSEKNIQLNRPEPLKGTKEQTSLKMAEQYKWLFISGFDKDTETEHILTYIKENGFDQKCVCEKMKTRKRQKSSFKLGVPGSIIEDIQVGVFWPTGSLVNHFMNLQSRPRTRSRYSPRSETGHH